MEYLVMECSQSCAIVLDNEGRFLKVPNLGYEVGQTLNRVVLMDAPSRHRPLGKHFARWSAIAACLCIMIIGSWNFWQSPIGTVRMQINPDVQMSVNRFDRVIDLEGLNEDGKDLIKGYRVYGKKIQAASDELADRAMDLGYLSDGGRITLTVESDRESWKTATEELLLMGLDVHFEHHIIVVAASADVSDVSDDIVVIQPGQILPEQTNDDDDVDGGEDDDDDLDDVDDSDDRDDRYDSDDLNDDDDDDDDDDIDDIDDVDDVDGNDDDDDDLNDIADDDDNDDQYEKDDGEDNAKDDWSDDDNDPDDIRDDDEDDEQPQASSLEYEDDWDERTDASDDSDDNDFDGTTSDLDDEEND